MKKYIIFPLLMFLVAGNLFGQIKSHLLENKYEKRWKVPHPTNYDTLGCIYEFEYPSLPNSSDTFSAINRIIQKLITGDTVVSLNAFFNKESAALKEELDTLLTQETYPLEISYFGSVSVQYANDEFISFVMDEYGMSGGAHGNSSSKYYLYNKKTWMPIMDWRNLVSDTAEFLEIAENVFRKLKDIPENEATNENWFWGESFYLPNNFGIQENGMVFFYNTYDIASYADGPTELLLTWNNIEKIIKFSVPK